jgi:hypothetical protein
MRPDYMMKRYLEGMMEIPPDTMKALRHENQPSRNKACLIARNRAIAGR